MELSATFVQAFIAAVGSATAVGLIATIRMLNTIHSDVKTLKEETAGIKNSLDSVFVAFRYVLTATRYQNVALKQAGANGCTEQSDSFIDKAEASLDRRSEKREAKV